MKTLSDLLDRTPGSVHLQWGVKIPLRDGIRLSATVYTSKGFGRRPCVVTLTPYVAQLWHHFALYFAARGYPFIAVDCRGRGNSEGEFRPFIQEAQDGHDVVEWVAGQPYCNGKVTMWGGSYGGYVQWATASQAPPHLATIVPVAPVYVAHDFPMRSNVPSPYIMQWLTFVSGRTAQEKLFFEAPEFWSARYREWFESGKPFRELDTALGNPSPIFQEWIAHPQADAYWDAYSPTSKQRAALSIPVLTITGIYDSDQPGALRHYQEHLSSSSESRSRHYLIIGPWHHAGTRVPKSEFAGLKLGPESLVDLPSLHLQWYRWTMEDGPQPEFLKKPVAYYVLGAEKWRYADSLEATTAQVKPLYLDSAGDASRVCGAGTLGAEVGRGREDVYVYDPTDTRIVEAETVSHPPLCLRPTFPTEDLTDQTLVFAQEGQALIYHSAPFEQGLEITGFFRLSVWLSINTPDTDIRAIVYAIDGGGGSTLLSSDWIRARYRRSLREAQLIETTEPLRYDFTGFTFVSILMWPGSRLRLVIGPMSSIYSQKNYNSGGLVAEESMKDARRVTVMLYHDRRYPGVLYVPFGAPETPGEPIAPVSSLISASSSRGTTQ